MEINEALCHLGKYSRWHILNFLALGLAFKVPFGLHFTSIIYISYKPPYRCKASFSSTNHSQTNETFTCEMHLPASEHLVPCQNGWEFPNFTGSTIVTEWQLVCDRQHMPYISQTCFVAGFILGCFILSILTDKYGRRRICLRSLLLIGVSGVSSSFSPNFGVFSILTLLIGAFNGGVLVSGYSLINEIYPSHQRTFSGILILTFWSFSLCLCTLLAYLIENWRYLQLSLGLYSFLVLPLFCWIRESVLWDISNGRREHAEETLRMAAKMNGVTFNEPVLKRFELKAIDNNNNMEVNIDNIKTSLKNDFEDLKKKDSSLGLFTNKVMLFYLLSAILLWFGSNYTYYCLFLGSATMHANRFLNTSMGTIAEVPIFFIVYFSLRRFGRKKPFATFLFLSAIFSFIGVCFEIKRNVIPEICFYFMTVITILCKICMSASFAIIFLYTSELFPTKIRVTALGISSMVGRTGTFLSILTIYFMEKIQWGCFLLFGVISSLMIIIIICLPETHNKQLPNSIEEACALRINKCAHSSMVSSKKAEVIQTTTF